MNKASHVLFVTWDGPGSVYLESLFLPIFKILNEHGFIFHVIQFSWASRDERRAIKFSLEACGVNYRSIPVMRIPVSVGSLVSVFFGAYYIRRAVRELNIDVVMSRSTLPSISSILALKYLAKVYLLFDADGLPHDERVDFNGMKASGLVYRLLRDFEALVVRRADAILTRSAKAIDILYARGGAGLDLKKFYVVTNGRDENLFRPVSQCELLATRQSLNIPINAPLIVYAGSSVSGKYCGVEMFEFIRLVKLRRNDAHFLILTGAIEDVNLILDNDDELRQSCHIKQVPPREVARYLAVSDLGLVFIHPKFSMQAVSAIKLGEYLLCGLPVLATAGIGDTDVISADSGMVIQLMDAAALNAAAGWFVDSVLPHRELFRAKSRELGLARFAVGASAVSYRDALQDLVRKP